MKLKYVFKITLDPHMGGSISRIAEQALALTIFTEVPVEFTFNDVVLTVTDQTPVYKICANYDKGLEALRNACPSGDDL